MESPTKVSFPIVFPSLYWYCWKRFKLLYRLLESAPLKASLHLDLNGLPLEKSRFDVKFAFSSFNWFSLPSIIFGPNNDDTNGFRRPLLKKKFFPQVVKYWEPTGIFNMFRFKPNLLYSGGYFNHCIVNRYPYF